MTPSAPPVPKHKSDADTNTTYFGPQGDATGSESLPAQRRRSSGSSSNAVTRMNMLRFAKALAFVLVATQMVSLHERSFLAIKVEEGVYQSYLLDHRPQNERIAFVTDDAKYQHTPSHPKDYFMVPEVSPENIASKTNVNIVESQPLQRTQRKLKQVQSSATPGSRSASDMHTSEAEVRMAVPGIPESDRETEPSVEPGPGNTSAVVRNKTRGMRSFYPDIEVQGNKTLAAKEQWMEEVEEEEKKNAFSENSPRMETSPSDSVICQNATNGPQCCGTWDVNADDWFLHHPDWEVTQENETSFCFTPIQNHAKAKFLRDLHDRQWNGNCDDVEKSVDINSGFGAGVSWLLYSFWHAHKNNKPFQICHTNRRWLYSTANASSWAYCDDLSMACYYLPISPCDRNETVRGMHKDRRPKGPREELEALWMRQYMLRPQQHFRQKQFAMRQKLDVPHPCTTMHVRRGDAGLPRKPYRRYAAVSEYLEKANAKAGDKIVLLTDDESTIEEIKRYHPDYNWYYYDRPRNHAIAGGFDGHIPSGDEAFELLVIESELKLASSCEKVVYGNSGFMKELLRTMEADDKNFTSYYVETRVSEQEAKKFNGNYQERVASFFREIEENHNKTHAGSDGSLEDAKDPPRGKNASIYSHNERKQGSYDSESDKARVEVRKTQKEHEDATRDEDEKDGAEAVLLALSSADPDSAIVCHNTTDGSNCCGTWDIDADTWWLHHPDWHVTYENETSFCFSPYNHERRVEFVKAVHQRQWATGSCDEMETTREIGSGFGASVSWLLNSFWHAHKNDRPFQILNVKNRGLFNPRNSSRWGYCDSEDIFCYVLPITRCSRNSTSAQHEELRPKNKEEAKQLLWLRKYLLRPRQSIRRKVYEMKLRVEVKHPCTTIHVRRGDVGFAKKPFRRYAAVSEYLDLGGVKRGDNIVLLTDDETTIEEVQKYHKDEYNWIYFDRPRVRGISGGFEGHVPSGDGATELVTILAEMDLAASCEKIVHGVSGFMKQLRGMMDADERKYTSYWLNTRVDPIEAKRYVGKPQEREALLFNHLEQLISERQKRTAEK